MNASTQLDAIFQAFPDLLFTLDESGVILDYRAGAAVSTLFAPPESFIGQRIGDVLPPEFARNLLNALEQHNVTHDTVPFEYTLRQAGAQRWFEARIVPAANGQVVVVVRDATRHKQAEERFNSQLKRIAALRAIDLAISSSLDMHLALSVVLSQVTAQLAVDAADILLLNQQGVLEFAAGVGFHTDALLHTSLQMGEGFAGMVALQQKMISIPDLGRGKTGFLRSPHFTEEGFHCYFGVPLVAKGRVRGVLEVFHRHPLAPDDDWLEFLETLAGEAAIAAENAVLLKELQRTNLELTLAYNTTIEGWSRALDLRDRDTEGHTQRVTDMAVKLARRLGFSESEVVHVRRGAVLHDIGKMAIPDSILLKPGPLTPEEWEVIRQHPRYAYELLSPIPYLGSAIDIPHYHHERWDGAGYPHNLRESEIPLPARLFAVVDVYDALTSHRPYRPAWKPDDAAAYIGNQSGKHFDPEVAAEFLRMLNNPRQNVLA
ncbi:MAG TPA: HD domain-containing phosphohydrolase [Anaerolineales bacterium]|nr:HD domain-containing phosphohydrolase [Anaerolineales bacterium]